MTGGPEDSGLALRTDEVEGLADAIARDLTAAPESFFAQQGAKATREMTTALLLSLSTALASGRTQALRACLSRLVPRSVTAGMTFHDIQLLCSTTRRRLLAAHASRDGGASLGTSPRALEDALQELTLASALYYTAQRESTIADQAAQLEIQLAEMRSQKETQQHTMEQLRQIWTPIAPIYDRILAVPLVGALDTERAAVLTGRLLHEIITAKARFVLLDISGVPTVDTATADHLIRMTRAVRLLGSELVLVGVSPAIAGTLVTLGLDLTQMKTQGSLRDGLRLALSNLGLHVAPRK